MNSNTPEIPAVSIAQIADHVVHVAINRPDAMNAVNRQVAVDFERTVRATEEDDDVWAVVLSGTGGRAFCAGADLKYIAAGGVRDLFTPDGGFAGFVHAKRSKLWIAAVEGFALAGGCEIALACDLIVATEQATFGLPEVRRGLLAAAGGAYRLPRAIPPRIATELLVTGGRIDARRAFVLGLVNRLVHVGEAVSHATESATMICGNAPLAVRESLAIARASADATDEALRTLSDQAMERIAATADFLEGPRAFAERRAPQWSGR